jgi:hypothetical protein
MMKSFKRRESLNLYSSPVCHILSNACVMSKNAAEQYYLFSRALFICCTIRCVEHLNWELFYNPPYSPDLTPSNNNLFTYLKSWL